MLVYVSLSKKVGVPKDAQFFRIKTKFIYFNGFYTWTIILTDLVVFLFIFWGFN